jgi:signal transduction histidine kinase
LDTLPGGLLLEPVSLTLVALSLTVGAAIGRYGVKWRGRRDRPHPALERARALLNALPDTWLVIDANEQVVELHIAPRPGSKAAVPLLRGRRIDEFFSPRVVEKLRGARQRVLDDRVEEDFEFDLHVRGEARAAHARILPLVGSEVVMVIQDISERKMTERALRETRDFAESMLAARTDAFARLSHDLRNQMTGVLTITDLLLARSGQPAVRNYIETIQRCGDHIVELVSNMMELSRLERGSINLHATEVDLHGLVEECVTLARTLAAPKVTVSFQCLPGSPERVFVDGPRLRQILTNLLHNAAKFTVEGAIMVEVTASGPASFRIDVRDTGPGIPAEALPRIFDAYFQVRDPAREDPRQTGSGLGLAIVQQLTRALGGDVSVESEAGLGTCFSVVLPLRAAN